MAQVVLADEIRPTEAMWGQYWLLVSLVILMAMLLLATGGVARLWSRFCLDRVVYRRRLSRERVFFR